MEFQGKVAVAAAQTAVWHTLTTPSLVSQCTPRLQGWTALEEDTQFPLQFIWGRGGSTVIIPFVLIWQTVTPPTYLQWQGKAQMGSTAVPLQGDFHLSAAETTQTQLAFSAQLTPPNKFVGQMIQNTAPRLIEHFFNCLKKTAEAV